MAKRLSTGMVNYLSQEGGISQALTGGVLDFFTGTQATSADDATTATHLCRFTLAGGSYTQETRAAAKILLAGASGSIDTLTIGGISIISAAVPYNASLLQTKTDLVTAINNTRSYPEFKAVAGGGVLDGVTYGTAADGLLYIVAPKNSGTAFNAIDLAIMTTTLTVALNGGAAADDQTGQFATASQGDSGTEVIPGVAAVNGLSFVYPNSSAGVLVKETGAWQGTAVATGTVGWFRFSGNNATSGATPTGAIASNSTAIRFDGTVGTSGTDMIVSSTSITSGAVQTINTFTINTLTTQ